MSTYPPVTDMLDQPPAGLDADELATLPPALAARPWHPRLNVPVPFMNVHTDDEHTAPFVDFLGLDPKVAARCAAHRLCGLCGAALPEEIAFLGPVESARHRVFADPPFHETCARAALRWCPHLRLRNHQPAPAHRRHPDTPVLDGWDERTRPDQWALVLASSYTLANASGLLLFQPVNYRSLTVVSYTGPNNSLVEVSVMRAEG